MIYLRRSILQVLIITFVCNLYTCVIANQGLAKCKDEMKKVFNDIQKPLITCIQYAIRKLILYDETGNIISSYNPDVANYYKSFITKVTGENILLRSEYCLQVSTENIPYTDPNKNAVVESIPEKINRCMSELAIFGDSQEAILNDAIFKHKQHNWIDYYNEEDEMAKRGESLEESKNKHIPSKYGYFYLDHIAKVITLLEATPYVLTTHPNKSEVSIVVESIPSPEDYCIYIHRPS